MILDSLFVLNPCRAVCPRGRGFALRSSVALLVAVASASACTSPGDLGGPCIASASFDGSPYCNGNLICGVHDTCEEPQTVALGGACDQDEECQIGLWCAPGSPMSCAALLGLGETCHDPQSCALGLVCEVNKSTGVPVQNCEPAPDGGWDGGFYYEVTDGGSNVVDNSEPLDASAVVTDGGSQVFDSGTTD